MRELLLGLRGFRRGLSPRHPVPARAKAREVAAARRAAVRGRAEPENQPRPERRMVILLAPRSQVLPIAARAAREFPRAIKPDAGFPARAAAAAAQRIYSKNCPAIFAEASLVRHTYISCSALWAGELHLKIA